MTHYEVRFTCYHYNSGCADNGYYRHKEKFETAEAALAFAERIKEVTTDWLTMLMLTEEQKRERGGKSGDFVEEYLPYVWDGTVHEFLGVFEVEINERKLS